MRVLICGGGVIGTSLAYFLARRGAEAVVIERCGVACAASGRSGGFLALDWCDGSWTAQLARRSFALHGELAESLNGAAAWGYRRLETLGVLWSADADLGDHRKLDTPDWLEPAAAVYGRIGSAETTAQIDPARFTRAMMDAALARGAQLVSGEVTGLTRGRDGAVAGVAIPGREISGDAVVVALGPWSSRLRLRLPAVLGFKGLSLVFGYAPPRPQALFAELALDGGARASAEVVPRADGTTYVCGLSDRVPLPADPAAVGSTPEAFEGLRALTAHLAPDLAAAPVLSSGACYRPVTQDGRPLLGPVPDLPGAYVAAGHGSWGMLQAPASAEAMAELILDGPASTVDLAPFDPARLPLLELDGAAP